MRNKLKDTRAVTYRRPGIPALILEGKWLTEKYRLNIGDVVGIDYQPAGIRLHKNTKLSVERKQTLKELQEIKNKVYADTNTVQNPIEGSGEGGRG